MTHRSARGFSLVELAVALTIAGILLALGAPAVSGYLQSARLGTFAKSVYSGLQTARAEAVKRNQEVEFVLTSSSLESATPDSVVLDSTGRNWVVRVKPGGIGPFQLVEQNPSNSSEAGGVVVASTQNRFTFNSLGGSGAGVVALSNPAIGLCSPTGPTRCWNVVVAAGGQIRMCSPGLVFPDSRAC